MVSETSYTKASLDTKLAGKANFPSGGTDGQALTKSGSTTVWATITGGNGGGSSFDVFANAPLGGTSKDDAAILATINANPGKVVHLQPGAVYQIDSLALPSNTTLDLNGSELRQVNPTGTGGPGACVRNQTMTDASVTSNTDIWVRNGRISVGAASSARPVSFQGVSRLKLTDLTVEKRTDATFSDFMCSIRCVDDFLIDSVKVTGGTLGGEDGIHLGGVTRGRVSNCVVDSGDDALAIVHQFNMGRASANVVLSNCVLRSATAHIVRITVYTGETFGVSGITYSNIVGDFATGNTSDGCKFFDQQVNGMVSDVVWEGGAIDLTNQTSTNAAISVSGVTRLSLNGVRVRNGNGKGFNVDTSTDLNFNDCHVKMRAGAPASSTWQFNTCSRVSLIGCSSDGSTQHGFYISTGTGSADFSFHGCRVRTPSQFGFKLNDVTGVRLTGSLINGGTGGVVCDGTAVPSGVILVANKVTTNSGSLLGAAPAGTIAVANTGIADTIGGGGTTTTTTVASTDIQTFTTSGTWTKPAIGTTTRVYMIGGGSGGGSGRRGAAGSNRFGGGGGGGGGKSWYEMQTANLGSTVAVTVGGGGSGGTAVTTDNTDGNIGTSGASSLFGTFLRAGGANSTGTAGTAATASGASGGTGTHNGQGGVGSQTTQNLANTAGGGGGAGGGNITSANVVGAGGTSQDMGDRGAIVSFPGGAAGGGLGATPNARTVGYAQAGGGGSGGGANDAGAAGAGGDGAAYGGGGGGGGASLNGFASGAGGAGSPGVVVAITA